MAAPLPGAEGRRSLSQGFSAVPTERVHWLRTRRKRPCPICGRYDWCEISEDGWLVHCMQVPSDKPMRWRGGGWIHELGVRDKKVGNSLQALSSKSACVSTSNPQPLSLAQIDQVNRALLGICPLSEQHRAYLESGGVDPGGCGSLFYSQAASIAKTLVALLGEEVANQHPTLLKVMSEDGKRQWWTLAGAADGILFPATSHEGLVLGVQIRKDKPRGKDDRYRWLSHGGLGGTPLTVFKASAGAQSPHHLIITEGYKKAAVASQTWQCHSISLAGVTSYRATDLIQTIEALGVQSISLAFDQDKLAKSQVQEAEQKLLRILAAACPTLELYYLEWDGTLGKGLDDALKAGAQCEFKLAAPQSGPRFVSDLPLEALARVFGSAKPLYTLEEARKGHRAFMDRIVASPDYSTTLITSVTGTGKSQACDDAVAEAVMQNRLHPRTLILAPNKANIEERTRPHNLLGKAVASGKVAIQRGRRLVDLGEPYSSQPEDCANPEALQAGAARHAAAKVVCSGCPFSSPKNWEATFPGQPRPFQCEKEGYLASRKKSDEAQAVLATKEAYLNNSEKLGEFDLIICDEDLLPYLYESVIVNTNVMQGWREKIALKQLAVPDWVKLMQVIEHALDTLSGEFQVSSARLSRTEEGEFNPENEAVEEEGLGRLTSLKDHKDRDPQLTVGEGNQILKAKIYQLGRLYPAMPALEKAASELGYILRDLLAECAKPFKYDSGKDETYNFEKHYRHNGKLVLPYRAATVLLRALMDKENPPYLVCNVRGSFSLEIFEVRGHLIETLRQKTLVILDATVPPQLLSLFPDLQELHYEVKQNIEVTQVTNALYSKQDLYNPVTRQQLGETIKAFTKGSKKPLAMLPLRFQQGSEAIELPQHCQSEHWGLHKATSKFSSCDTLVMVGHHLRPIDRIRAEVIAFRAVTRGWELEDREVEPNLHSQLLSPKRKLRLYNHLGMYGYVSGRWMHCDQDAEVQAAIEHDFVSHVKQAIGRLRAALRSIHLPPARVLILCNEPVADLKIDFLTTASRIRLGTKGMNSQNWEIKPLERTNPLEKENFIQSIYMETPEKDQLVPLGGVERCTLQSSDFNSPDLWDIHLVQDETVETQDAADWIEELWRWQEENLKE